jgi:hypothetical protein
MDMSDEEGDDDSVVRTVDPLEEGGHVTLPAEWVGARVEVVRAGPDERDRAGYALADADDAAAFATRDDGGPWAGPDVADHLRRGSEAPATFYLGLADDGAGAYHAATPRRSLADGLAVLGDDRRASALLSNLAWQAVAGGAGGAVLSRAGPTARRFARALPDGRAGDLQVVGGPEGRSVNLLDPGVPPSSAAFFDAVDAATDALVSLLTVASPQLRDAIREFVMVASGGHDDASLLELHELVRYGVDEDADVPGWVTDESPDLLERVAGVDDQAVEWLLDSLAPLLAEPARSLLADPDPDVALVEVVRSRVPLVVAVGDRYDGATWRAVGRAVVHGCWGAAREFVADGADHPFYVVGDEFGPVLDAEPDLSRLFARLHRDRVVPAFGVTDPGTVDDALNDLVDETGAHAAFAGAGGRAGDLDGVDADAVASLAPGECLVGGDTVERRRLLGYHPMAAERDAEPGGRLE